MRTQLLVASIFLGLTALGTAQDGVSSAGAARSRYLGNRGVLPSSRDIVVEDIVNYHRHEIGRPKAGEAVGIDLAWQKSMSWGEAAILQVGLSTALLNDKAHLRPLNLALVIDKSGSMSAEGKLDRVKQALQTLLGQLRPTDVLSLVEFDSEADVLVAAQPLGNGEAFRSAIRVLRPGSSTNLNAGLMLGYKEAAKNKRPGWTNRVVLLTDGIANQGVVDPDEIASGSLRYNDQGIDLSTIGLGMDLNKDLLAKLAKSGRGLFHFIADTQDIDKVFAKEVQSLVSPVAMDPNLEINIDPSLELERVYGYEPFLKGNTVRLKLDNMNSGMTEVVILKLKPGSTSRERRLPVRVRLSYFDLATKKQIVKTDTAYLTLKKGGDAGTDPNVTKNFTIAMLAQAMKDMAAACEQQRFREGLLAIDGAIAQAHESYPSMDDPDITRTLTTAEQYQSILKEKVGSELTAANIISNGDFSLGNAGFTSELTYAAPRENCLWPSGYTVMPQFNSPQLHTLIAGLPFSAPKQQTGREQVLFANAGGAGTLNVWTTTVKCEPNTQYRLSFQGISLTPGREWIPTFAFSVNGAQGSAQSVPDSSYREVSMVWNSGSAHSATVSILRLPMNHNGGLIGIANIEMAPIRRLR